MYARAVVSPVGRHNDDYRRHRSYAVRPVCFPAGAYLFEHILLPCWLFGPMYAQSCRASAVRLPRDTLPSEDPVRLTDMSSWISAYVCVCEPTCGTEETCHVRV